MKKIFLLCATFAITSLSFSQTKTEETVKYNAEKFDFGKIKQGVPATCFFEITNISKKPLVIESATASCGCTVPEYPKEPVMPGKTAKIKVQYNAASVGVFNKDVYIKIAGVDAIKTLRITGEVQATPTTK